MTVKTSISLKRDLLDECEVSWNLNEALPFSLQPMEISALVLEALLLQKNRPIIVGGKANGRFKVSQIQDRGVRAPHEVY